MISFISFIYLLHIRGQRKAKIQGNITDIKYI